METSIKEFKRIYLYLSQRIKNNDLNYTVKEEDKKF